MSLSSLEMAFAENGQRQENALQALIVLRLLATPRQTSLLLETNPKIGISLLEDHAVARLRIAQTSQGIGRRLPLHRASEANLLQERLTDHHAFAILRANALTPTASTGIPQSAESSRRTASAVKAENATSCMLVPMRQLQKARPKRKPRPELIQLSKQTRTK